MKKLLLSAALFALAPLSLNALEMTDPFFIPEKGAVISDTTLGFTNNAFKLNKSWGIYESVSVGIDDKFSAGVSLGWADMRHADSGMQDLALFAKYRISDQTDTPYFLDIEAYLSPKLFHSPYNNKKGAAKGSTDLGFKGTMGSTQISEGFTLGASAGLDIIGHTDIISSGSIADLTGFAKYYADKDNSFSASVSVKGYWGFNQDFLGLNLGINYARNIIEDKLAVVPFYNIEVHNKDITSSAVWGINARFLF